jgi:hypothetical protein
MSRFNPNNGKKVRQRRSYQEQVGYAVVDTETGEVIGVYKDKYVAVHKAFGGPFEVQETVMNWDTSGAEW